MRSHSTCTSKNTPSFAGYHTDADIKKGCKKIRAKIQEEEKNSRINLLPSTSLATGYYENFLKPISQELYKQESLEIEGDAYDIRQAPKMLDILIPRSVSGDWKSFAELYCDSLEVKRIELHGILRNYSVLLDYPAFTTCGSVRIIDFPNILQTAFRAVELATGKDYIGNIDQLIYGKEKEMRNFIRTLMKFNRRECLRKKADFNLRSMK